MEAKSEVTIKFSGSLPAAKSAANKKVGVFCTNPRKGGLRNLILNGALPLK